MLNEFYDKFYGPASKPMGAYWTAIHDAWEKSIVEETEPDVDVPPGQGFRIDAANPGTCGF